MTAKGRVLFVDDEPDFTEIVQWQLEKRQYQIVTKNNGHSALKTLSETEFDVLVADIRMPGMSGIELISQALAIHPDLQCIVITGHGDIDTAIEAMRAGAVNYLRKPASIDELDVAIDKAMTTLRLIRVSRAQQEELERNYKDLQSLRKQLEELLAQETTRRETAENALRERVIRETLVETLFLSLRLWRQATKKTKVDFAEESKLWNATVDNNGTYRTRTLDKYLKLESLPPNPRYNDVIDSAYFVIANGSLPPDMKQKLEEKVAELEKLLL